MNLIQQIEVYRLETICGLYSKEELIKQKCDIFLCRIIICFAQLQLSYS